MSKLWKSMPLAAGPLLLIGCGHNDMMDRGYMMGPGPVGTSVSTTTMMSVSPAPGASGIAVGTVITLRFSYMMGPGMEQYVVLHAGDINGPLIPMNRVWSADRTTLICTPATALDRLAQYTVHMGGGIVDANGRAVDLSGMPMMGGQWAVPGMMMGGWPGYMMGTGWPGQNGTYGMVWSFTTS